MSRLLPEDIADMKYALSILTREELETFCLERCIRLDISSSYISKELQYQEETAEILNKLFSGEEIDEMNRVMDIVKSQLDFGEK